MFFRRWAKWIAACLLAGVLTLALAGCGEAKSGVTVVATNASNPSWTIEDLKFAQDFRNVLEGGTTDSAQTDRGEDYYNVTIKNEFGEWHYKLWVDLEGTEPAAAMDSRGTVRLINDYDSGVIRQIFHDAKKNNAK